MEVAEPVLPRVSGGDSLYINMQVLADLHELRGQLGNIATITAANEAVCE